MVDCIHVSNDGLCQHQKNAKKIFGLFARNMKCVHTKVGGICILKEPFRPGGIYDNELDKEFMFIATNNIQSVDIVTDVEDHAELTLEPVYNFEEGGNSNAVTRSWGPGNILW